MTSTVYAVEPDAGADSHWLADANNCHVWNPHPIPGESIHWSGQCKDGYLDGPGVMQWFQAGQANGQSESTYVTGKRSGHNISSDANGTRFEGDMLDDVPNGYGIMTVNSGIRYEGNFDNGRFRGHGILTWPYGTRYVGDFVDGKKEGQGVTTFANGTRYEGSFHNGFWDGHGTLSHADGTRFVGDFVAGKMSGEGVSIDPNGAYFHGRFANNQPVDGTSENYSIRETVTGSLIPKPRTYNLPVPPQKTYSQLTETQKSIVKSRYEAMKEGDEPPYPLYGLKSLFEAMSKVSRSMQPEGVLSVVVHIDATGKATEVKILKSPDSQLTENAATVLMLQQYKPAVCSGQPCAMDFPFSLNFHRTLVD